MQLGFFWCGKIRDGGCGKEIFSDDAVPHAHKNLHKSVLLGFGWLGPVLSLYAMTCREEKKQQQVKLFVFLVFFSLSFPSLHETVLGYWIMIHCLYDSPLPIHIIIPWSSFEGNHWERKEKRKKEKARTPLVLSIDFFFSFLCFCCLPDSLFYSFIWHLPIFISIIIRSVSISVHLIQFSFQNTVHSYMSTTQTHTQDTYNRPCHLS